MLDILKMKLKVKWKRNEGLEKLDSYGMIRYSEM